MNNLTLFLALIISGLVGAFIKTLLEMKRITLMFELLWAVDREPDCEQGTHVLINKIKAIFGKDDLDQYSKFR